MTAWSAQPTLRLQGLNCLEVAHLGHEPSLPFEFASGAQETFLATLKTGRF